MAEKKVNKPVAKNPAAKKTETKKPVKKGSIHDPGVKGTMHDSIDTRDFTPSSFHGK